MAFRRQLIDLLSNEVRSASSLARELGMQLVFGEDRLLKPGRCPECKGPRLFEPMIRIRRAESS